MTSAISGDMTCAECANWLHPYLDNELEADDALRVHAHLAGCAACNASHDAFKALRQAIKKKAPYYAAPPLLKQRITASHKSARVRDAMRTWTLPAFSATALAASLLLFLAIPQEQTGDLTDEVVSSHVRSLMEQHLMDVVSTDKHTVKPWFTGKIDFTPPVYDFAEQGYPLVGGRLDYLDHKTVAALIYHRNKHVINVFVYPGDNGAPGFKTSSRRGYNLVTWQQGQLVCEAVSDLNAQELSDLARLIVAKQ